MPITRALLARDDLLADEIGEGQRGLLTAPPLLSLDTAKLPAFGRIDAPQAGALAMNFNRVAIDHVRPAMIAVFCGTDLCLRL